MFRYIIFAIFGALAAFFCILLHVNPLYVVLFLALGAVLGSNGESEVGYKLSDWARDRFTSAFGWARSYTEAKITTLMAKESKVQAQIEAERKKLVTAVKARL